jgi:hypothetical protein
MAEREVVSPVTQKGSKVGSGQPLSPGSRSSPSRAGGPQTDSVPPQPSHGGASRHSEDPLPSAATTVVGPEE